MATKTSTKKTVTPKSAPRAKSSLNKNEIQAEINKLLKQLDSAKTPNRKKTLRKQLRNFGHQGGLKSLKEKSNG